MLEACWEFLATRVAIDMAAEAVDVSNLGTEAHELTEVATEAALRGRNGRLLVQTGGRHLVRAPSTFYVFYCAHAHTVTAVFSGSHCASERGARYRCHLLPHGWSTAGR